MEPRPPTRRQQRHAARRDEVLAAALAIVEADGIEALTIAGLAAAVGSSVGALYRYFPGKASLLVALQQEAIAALSQDIASSIARSRHAFARSGSHDASTGSLQHLVAAIAPLVDLPRTHPSRYRLIDELLSAPSPLLSTEELAEVNATLVPLLEQVDTLFLEAVASGALAPGDARQRTRLVWAALHGLDHFRKRDHGEPLETRVATLAPLMLETLFVGFGADRSRAAAVIESVRARPPDAAP